MKEEDQNMGDIEAEMIELVNEYIKENARIVIVAHQNAKLIESISAYFKDLDWNVELIQYDFNTAIRLQRPEGFPFLQESNQEARPENDSDDDNQGRNVNMIQQSQDYQNQLPLNHCQRRKSQPSQDIIKHQRHSQEDEINEPQGIYEIQARFSLRRRKQKGNNGHKQVDYIEVPDQDEKEEEMINEREKPNDDPPIKKEEVQQGQGNKKSKSRKNAIRRRQLRRIRSQQESCEEITFKGRRPVFPSMERRLAQWIRHMCGWGRRITQQEIRNNARTIVADMRLGKGKKFSASKGWIEKFLRRYPKVAEMLNYKNKKKIPDELKDE